MNHLEFIIHHYKEGIFNPKKGLERFRERTGTQKEGDRLRLLRYIAAAASLALIIAAGGVLYHLQMNRWEDVTAKTFVLPDQSVIRLQEGAVLSFQPRRFAEERTVKLSGIAYFEVNHEEEKPFEVHSVEVKVRVMGTKFLFNASDNTVYVDEGRVLFSVGPESLELTKGHYAVVKGQVPVLSAPELPNPSAWATGRLQYDAVPLGLVLKELSILFGRDLSLQSAEEPSLTGEFALSDGLPRILSLIESALDVVIE